MPRFSAAFSRRKSTADDLQNALMANPAEQSSFRVMERPDAAAGNGKSFDGGVRLARASGVPMGRPSHLDTEQDDNMFANLKGDRGSGASNFTKATSTDNSSRHSNASTAPSSADMAAAPDNSSKKNLHEVPGRRSVTSSGSNFLSKAGRTFSFGAKKAPAPSSPDVPPIPTIQREDEMGRARGLTNSTIDTQTTTTPPRLGESGGMDMGGDFGNMFSGSGFDKRASQITLKNTNNGSPQAIRQKQPATLHLDSTSRVESGPLSWNSEHSNDGLLNSRSPPLGEQGPPVPRHQPSFEMRPANHSPDTPPDEEAKLLQDTLAAARFISTVDEEGAPPANRYRSEQDSFTVIPRKAYPSVAASHATSHEDNMFAGSPSRITRQQHRQPARNPNAAPQNKVMTPEEFERYRRHKEQLGTAPGGAKSPVIADDDEDEDDINYDDDEDDAEKSKQQAKQRRKQEAHMAVYRQQMMKVTGETAPAPPVQSNRPNLGSSLSAPHLANFKSPSPDSAVTDEDEDEEVPLAILQAHGFPHKNRAPSRLNAVASNPNLRATSQAGERPGSSLGAPSNNDRQRHSTLPAFARGLPQDPFVGASVSRPAVRESLAFGGGAPAPQMPQQMPQQGGLPPGGLVGVIASEERSRAMRRGSPNMETKNFAPSASFQGQGMDPMASMPPQMMYGQQQGMGGMQMPQMPQLSAGDQAQIHMNQQMTQFMQMQMQFMQMMASQGQGGQMPPQMLPQMGQMGQMGMQGPYMGGPAPQSQADLSGRQSVMGDFEPPRMNAGMRTMSMVQPHTGFGPSPGYAPSFHSPAPGYTPSIAPSERSNIGLPGRYRPVSQAPASITNQHGRSNTMSGALSTFGDEKKKSTMNIVNKSGAGSDDDDDEEGWEAMKAKREKKRSIWRNKKDFGGILDAVS